MIEIPLYLLVLVLFSAISFIFFGVSCLQAPLMVAEFERYQLSNYRKTVGYLQLFGAASLIAGIFYLHLAILASLGLSLLMLLGVGVRLQIRDGILKTSPALFYFLLNAYLCYALLEFHNV